MPTIEEIKKEYPKLDIKLSKSNLDDDVLTIGISLHVDTQFNDIRLMELEEFKLRIMTPCLNAIKDNFNRKINNDK